MDGAFCLQSSVQVEGQEQQSLKWKRQEVWRLIEEANSQSLPDHGPSEITFHALPVREPSDPSKVGVGVGLHSLCILLTHPAIRTSYFISTCLSKVFQGWRAGSVLRAQAALPEEPGLFCNTRELATIRSSSPRQSDAPFRHRHGAQMYIHAGKAPIHAK